ncbi:hypothetical protein [Oscillibacter sp.]|uniref:hypothetical protein n=1 Tax=Oscillibacter sp. TaxID=1945593 RepID=UPI002616D0B3|nr:hypothetical protein [Oscillibacter sp.]MDD3346696.1 hypothetical protein [Oscillibacter sp.]
MLIATIVMWVVLLVFVVGGTALQIFLSRREKRWPGLLLPGVTFLYAAAMACNVGRVGETFPWGALLGAFGLGNIPTVILLAIYFSCREKRRKRSELDKMQIDDL